ncbi:hypothetical protein LCGC14_0860340 [marine sediment metagenome]|uniref:Uncharacterized protein n=1 Tax=marine sediment metagenome TaxID=412755 RepID=A0A0F9RS98_9ZZZZ
MRKNGGGIAEILESGQFPGTVVREPVRSAVLRDAQGRTTRVVYGGGIDAIAVEKDMQGLAERDGLDPSTSNFTEIVPEQGQGIGKAGDTLAQVKSRPRRKTNDIKVTSVPESE